jgi:RNA polymerase sigma factor (sigma-70 family)
MPPPAHGVASRLIAGPTLRAQPDRRLVRLVREGYESAFEEIVRRYGRQLGRYAAAIVGPRSEDVTQDAFSKALVALRRDEAEVELRPWLYRIVRNTALNDLRDRPAAAAELAQVLAAGGDPADEIERREELEDVITRLRALPDSQRAAIVMRELEGLSHEEIAAALGVSGGAARQAIHRARRALRDAAGLLVPLPLLRALLADGAAAEAAGGAIGVAGAGMAVKATAATVLVAGTVGTGVALKEERSGRDPAPRPGVAEARADAGTPGPILRHAPLDEGPSSGGSGGPGPNRGSGSGDDGDDRRGGDDSSGPSPRSGRSDDEDRSGPSRNERSHDDDADADDDGDGDGDGDVASEDRDGEDRSGPGEHSGSGGDSGGGGTSGSQSSGSGSGTRSGSDSGSGSGEDVESSSGSSDSDFDSEDALDAEDESGEDD